MTKKILVLLLVTSTVAFGEGKVDLPLPDSGSVTLSLEEYNKLIALAGKPPKKPEQPPLPYAVKRADLKLHVANESVQGTMQLDGEVFRKGVTKVPLTTGVTVFDAHQQAKPLPLEQDGGTHTAVLSGPSEFSVTLDAGLPLAIEAGRASFSLPVPAAGSVRLTLAMPGDHTNVRISPGLITNRKSENGETIIEATLVPGQPASIWWATREIAAPTVPKEVRFLSEIKALISVGEADLKIAALADINVIQGEPPQFELTVPEGYEVTGATGASLESGEVQSGVLILKTAESAQHNYQFLISMERNNEIPKASVPVLSFKDAQRETGEVLVESEGTMELTATEGGGLKRMDVKEVNPHLRSMARFQPQAAFRYHKQLNETPSLALEWVRFKDSPVAAAVAERAVVTTLVTSEGRSLTEVKLRVRNQAQPFLKVDLPQGASILSADVGGEKVKPTQDPDGSRVPLLRAGFHPTDAYTVSFVFLHAGAPFAKKGGSELALPKMDIPVSLLQWEVFLPEQYKVKDFGGDAIASNLLPSAPATGEMMSEEEGVVTANDVRRDLSKILTKDDLFPGQLGGMIVDQSGATVPDARITIKYPETGATLNAVTDQNGNWFISHLPSGKVRITASRPGFKQTALDVDYDASRPSTYNFSLQVASVSEAIMVTATGAAMESERIEREAKKNTRLQENAPSSNVLSLQQRVAGVLPVRVDVPRDGSSYHFVRPLVLDEETKLTFNYKTR